MGVARCTLCDGHGILATFAKGACIGSPCPLCDPVVFYGDGGWQTVYSRETRETHVIGSGVLHDVPKWVTFGG